MHEYSLNNEQFSDLVQYRKNYKKYYGNEIERQNTISKSTDLKIIMCINLNPDIICTLFTGHPSKEGFLYTKCFKASKNYFLTE